MTVSNHARDRTTIQSASRQEAPATRLLYEKLLPEAALLPAIWMQEPVVWSAYTG